MLSTHLASARSILCIGAHPDDIEIGCGGTLLQLIEQNPDVDVRWVVLGATRQRVGEARRSAESFLIGAHRREIIIERFRDAFFPYQGAAIKEFFNQLAAGPSPDLVFTHRREDLHQDHRLVAELTWNTFRDHLILEYEIPKYEGDLGHPNTFVPLPEATCQRKVRTIIETFASQCDKAWFTADAFWALLRLRGLECNAPSRFAEAMHCRKVVLSLTPVAPAIGAAGRRGADHEQLRA